MFYDCYDVDDGWIMVGGCKKFSQQCWWENILLIHRWLSNTNNYHTAFGRILRFELYLEKVWAQFFNEDMIQWTQLKHNFSAAMNALVDRNLVDIALRVPPVLKTE